jgi:hypothetical protein
MIRYWSNYNSSMRATQSEPDVKWDGFRPVMYSLAIKALDLPLKQVQGDGEQRQEGTITIAKVLQDFGGRDFQVAYDITSITVTSGSDAVNLQGPSFNIKLAFAILGLRKEGIEPYAARWFWYDKAVSNDPTETYRFFVVHQDKIVRDEISFHDYTGSGFAPSVFEGDDDEDWLVAWAAYWYRRFYRETTVGQLMTLRPDVPRLHYYPEGRPPALANGSSSVVALLRHIRSLLWAAIAILAFIVFLLVQK